MSTWGLLVFTGTMSLLVAAFGYIPATPQERRAEREAWNLRKPMDALDRSTRQRAFLLWKARRPALLVGVILLVTGVTGLIFG